MYRHRYRDTNTDIRVSTASAMGTWIQTNPTLFCQDQFLRYFAWMMTDRNALVRKETLKGIKILFQAQNGPYLNQKFTTKFIPRFVEMTQDVRKKKKICYCFVCVVFFFVFDEISPCLSILSLSPSLPLSLSLLFFPFAEK